MILSLEQLKMRNFQISDVNILHQCRTKGLLHKSRKVNGFLYILRGNCRYSFTGGAVDLAPGSVVYLPLGSAHVLKLCDRELEYLRVDFTVTADGETVLFSKGPVKMCHSASREFSEAAKTLEDRYQFVQDTIGKTALICRMLQELAASASDPVKERLAPAVRHLVQNLSAKTDCSCLPGLCNLSSAQFYYLFQQAHSMTPLQYRDGLLLSRAEVLLSDGGVTVAEAADILGFDSSSYFSRFFKKHRGISPLGFLKGKG